MPEAGWKPGRGAEEWRRDWRTDASVFLAVAVVLAFVNLTPALQLPFYQDDPHFMDLFRMWGGDYGAAARQEGFQWGFRPLGYVLRLFLWNLIGENAFAQHLVIGVAYVIAGAITARAAWRVGGHKLYGALAAMLFFSDIVTRRWVYSWVAFNPGDVLLLLTLLLTVEAAYEDWNPVIVSAALTLVGTSGLLMKENAIAAPVGAVLIAIALRKRLGRRAVQWIVGTQVLVVAAYAAAYASFAMSRPLTVGESGGLSVSQLVDVSRGFVYAVGGPITGIYLSMRKYGFGTGFSSIMAGGAVVAILWLLASAFRASRRDAVRWLRGRSGLIGMAVVLIAVNLAPYLPGGWFEMRMIVPAFAIGVVLWSCVLGDALRVRSVAGGWRTDTAILIVLTGLSAGAPLAHLQAAPDSLDAEVETTAYMRGVVEAALQDGVDRMCLVGFPNQGGALRAGNALHLVRHESEGEIDVIVLPDTTDVDRVMRTEDCAAIVYDTGAYHPVPIRVRWRSSATLR